MHAEIYFQQLVQFGAATARVHREAPGNVDIVDNGREERSRRCSRCQILFALEHKKNGRAYSMCDECREVKRHENTRYRERKSKHALTTNSLA